MVTGSTLTWTTGATLSGSSTIKIKVTDNAGNDGSNPGSQVYVLDAAVPTASVATANVTIGTNVATGQSTETGIVYLVKSTATPVSYAQLESLLTAPAAATKATVTTINSNTALGTTGLTAGTYKVYAVDAAGNISAASANTITLGTPPSITGSAVTFSADTGTSSTDLITRTAAQTISGALTGVTATGDTVQVSLDNGSTWVSATNTIGQSSWSLAGQTLTGSNTLQVRVTNGGFDGTAYSAAYVLDQTAPTTTISAVDISADTGTSASDFNTSTASQTITGTLSAGLVTGEILYGSVDGATTWIDVSNMVSGTAISWTGAALSGSSAIVFKVTDAAGNSGANTGSTSYVLDTTAPTTTISAVDISADTGTSASDFNTSTASQTITGTLSAGLVTGEILYGSVDGATTWIDVSNMVSGTAISWTGAALSGSSAIVFKVTDAAGNSGANTGSTSYVLDTTAPTTTVDTTLFSADTGTSSTDLITNTAAQNVSGTLSTNLVTGEMVQVSLDNGVNWVTASSSVGTSTWSLAGQALSGSGTLKVRVTDAAGNTGTEASHTFVLDTSAPLTTVTSMGPGSCSASDGIHRAQPRHRHKFDRFQHQYRSPNGQRHAQCRHVFGRHCSGQSGQWHYLGDGHDHRRSELLESCKPDPCWQQHHQGACSRCSR